MPRVVMVAAGGVERDPYTKHVFNTVVTLVCR